MSTTNLHANTSPQSQRQSQTIKERDHVGHNAESSSSTATTAESNIALSTTARTENVQADTRPWNIGRYWRIPKTIRVIFDAFPIVSLPIERAPSSLPSTKHKLYIFTSSKNAVLGAPSFNPTCLKWQTYLRICGVDVETIASSNHASPTGALPFVVPTDTSKSEGRMEVISSSKLTRWVQSLGVSRQSKEQDNNPDTRAYSTLLDTSIQCAWLFSLYLEENNFQTITLRNYTQSVPMFPVTYVLGREMKAAAIAQIKKSCGGGLINRNLVYDDADAALQALSILLDRKEWFFGPEPSIFDAAVFSYTHLLLDMPLCQGEDVLRTILQKYDNLVRHRQRMMQRYY